MKYQNPSELPFTKNQIKRRKSPKIIFFIALTSLLTLVPLYYFPCFQIKLSIQSHKIYHPSQISTSPDTRHHPGDHETVDKSLVHRKQINIQEPIVGKTKNDHETSKSVVHENCDLFTGEWVPNPDGPYYTNTTCNAIQEHQNCMKFGRPDTGFLKWRWKPDGCELPVFDPIRFLEMVRGKSLAFVGDSVARNHMQSLICLLSKVVNPVDVSSGEFDENRLYLYKDYNFSISIFSSPYLIRTEKTDPNDFNRPFNLFLDTFDQTWTNKIETFDYIIISAGQWFFRPTYFYVNRTLTSCLYCPESNITHMTSSYSYRWAFQTAFKAINNAANFKGVVFLRTFVPSHFEGGPWDKGGDCVRTRPFKRNETGLQDYAKELYSIQLEELKNAQKTQTNNGGKFRLFDATKAMLLRPDGHPSKYGHWPEANKTFVNDCVHWCLPGPIDSWNDILQELLTREVGSRNHTLYM